MGEIIKEILKENANEVENFIRETLTDEQYIRLQKILKNK